MWIVRGVFLGLGIFTVAEILYLYLGLYRLSARIAHGGYFAIDLRVIKNQTIHNPHFESP
jgi:hypothetical protein